MMNYKEVHDLNELVKRTKSIEGGVDGLTKIRSDKYIVIHGMTKDKKRIQEAFFKDVPIEYLIEFYRGLAEKLKADLKERGVQDDGSE